MDFKEIIAEKILSQCGIDLADYVINPYRGCELGCIYCYVQKNKFARKNKKPWGSYVDIKVNIEELLPKECSKHKPHSVMLGSTTEVYQNCERQYELTRKTLQILLERQVELTILTKSPLIIRDIDLLKQFQKLNIYFTVNFLPKEIVQFLEPKAEKFENRLSAIQKLKENNIETIVYINPVIPYLVDISEIMKTFGNTVDEICFESININVLDILRFKTILKNKLPNKCEKIFDVLSDRGNWQRYWKNLDEEINVYNRKYKFNLKTYFHSLEDYFMEIKYSS